MIKDGAGGVFNQTISNFRIVNNDFLTANRNAVYFIQGQPQIDNRLKLGFQGKAEGLGSLQDAVAIGAPEALDIKAGINRNGESQRK